MADVVLYEQDGPIARVIMNRPEYRNAQNSAMTYGLDDAFYRACADDEVKVIVLAGAGAHFSAGHDIGTPERDVDTSFDRRAGLWWDHVGKAGGESRYAREQEVYLGMCRRWREMPKPVIAQVQGACIAGGLMLAWICDLIVASDDAFFADPVVRMGIPGVEYFAHPWVMGPRGAKEFLFLGERISAARALELGMVNRVVPRDSLAATVTEMATKIAAMPRLGLALTKKAVNQVEDAMGFQTGLDTVFGLHHFAHAHNAETGTDSLAGHDAHSMRNARQVSEARGAALPGLTSEERSDERGGKATPQGGPPASERIVIVSGTGTGVGKTIVTAALATLAAARGERIAVVKPVQTGVADDEEPDLDVVRRLSGVTDLHELARFPDPLSPEAAARTAGLPPLDMDCAAARIAALAGERDQVIVEGAGGLLVRYDPSGTTIADLAAKLAAPVLVVTAAGLGTLNHTALTLEALATRGLRCAGVVIGSWPAAPGLAEQSNLTDLAGVLTGSMPEGAGKLTADAFRVVAASAVTPPGVP